MRATDDYERRAWERELRIAQPSLARPTDRQQRALRWFAHGTGRVPARTTIVSLLSKQWIEAADADAPSRFTLTPAGRAAMGRY